MISIVLLIVVVIFDTCYCIWYFSGCQYHDDNKELEEHPNSLESQRIRKDRETGKYLADVYIPPKEMEEYRKKYKR